MMKSLKNLYLENGIKKELGSSLNNVILAITFGVIFINITGGPALTGFARELQAKEFIFGILMAMPVIGGLFQLFASYVLEKTKKRKKVFLIFGVIQRALWIPVGLIPFVIPMEADSLRIWTVIILITVASSCGSFVNVSFFSWMADLIPGKFRGRFFSLRTRISTVAGLIASLIISKLLDVLPGFTGYTTVFILAGVMGVMDILCFIKVIDVPMETQEKKESMLNIIKQAFKDHGYRKYLLFWTLWGFTINFSAPFINLYALGNLKMSFTEINLTGQVVSNLTTIFFITKWGKFLDKFGSKVLLYITCTSTAVLLLLLVLASPDNYIPFLLFNLIGGMIWCGTDLANQNMLITHTPSHNRSMYIAIYSVLTTLIGNALAYIAGGYFLESVNKLNIHIFLGGILLNNYQLLFIVSSIMRLAAALVFLPGVPNDKPSKLKDVYSQTITWMRSNFSNISRTS
jgi:hypothetical protein